MTVGTLKKILERASDDTEVVIVGKDGIERGVIAFQANPGEKLGISIRKFIDVKALIESSLRDLEKGGYDEVDALTTLAESGIVLSDFCYDPARFEWAKELAEGHGIWPEIG